jgi:phosphate transport system substrate-binding protein
MTRTGLAGSLGLALLIGVLPASAGGAKQVKGEIKVDGSSTVYLITEAVASQFKKEHPAVNITVGISGTGGGFKKFANGETDLSDASRMIKPAEAENCKKNSIEFTEVQVGWDGIAVVIHPENTWARQLTLQQLKIIWQPNNSAKTWKDVDPSWPAERLDLYGPGPDSGTFDFFTEAANGKEKESRKDYNASEDDNTIVQGVARNKYALGYFGVAYYIGNKGKLGVAAVADKSGTFIEPTPDNVLSRKYPLSRPLFIYLNHKSLQRDEVKEFTRFYMRRSDLVSRVGYVPMSALQQAREKSKLEKGIKAVSK